MVRWDDRTYLIDTATELRLQIPDHLSRLLPKLSRSPGPEPLLTKREQEVLSMLAQGLSNAAIADELTVSVNTVRNHIANLSAKLGAHSKLEALSIAVRRGLVHQY